MTSRALRLAAPVLALALLSACGGNDDKPSGSAKASGSASASSSAGASGSAGPAATGPAVTATGYTYHLPNGWQDISTQLKSSQPGIDSGGRATPATPPFTANLNTVTQASTYNGKPSKSDLSTLSAQLKQEVASLVAAPKAFPSTTIDGIPAVHQEGVAKQGSLTFYLVQYMAVGDKSLYGITFALPEKATQAQRDAIVKPVLASFKFQQ